MITTGSRPCVAMLAVLLAAPIATAPSRAETVLLPQGLAITLPDGWRVDGPPEGMLWKSGIRRVQLVCESEACKTTQEACTILMREKAMTGADDAAKLRSLYVSPFSRYIRLRAVLRATSRDADIRKPLEITRIGSRDWYRVETDARHNYKSGLFAETVIDGRYLGAICKTCETGEDRHKDGQAIIGSLTSSTSHSASLR